MANGQGKRENTISSKEQGMSNFQVNYQLSNFQFDVTS